MGPVRVALMTGAQHRFAYIASHIAPNRLTGPSNDPRRSSVAEASPLLPARTSYSLTVLHKSSRISDIPAGRLMDHGATKIRRGQNAGRSRTTEPSASPSVSHERFPGYSALNGYVVLHVRRHRLSERQVHTRGAAYQRPRTSPSAGDVRRLHRSHVPHMPWLTLAEWTERCARRKWSAIELVDSDDPRLMPD
ncbi:hypothetical protein BD413DRAFT_172786 [Trametes elegans]|nr:hypothetical protein BD413DRAFT_172786 [Trametes elegans]